MRSSGSRSAKAWALARPSCASSATPAMASGAGRVQEPSSQTRTATTLGRSGSKYRVSSLVLSAIASSTTITCSAHAAASQPGRLRRGAGSRPAERRSRAHHTTASTSAPPTTIAVQGWKKALAAAASQ